MKENLAYLKTLIKYKTKIGIGVSGGPDSMTLFQLILDFFSENDFPHSNIFVIYCNHNIRKPSETEQEYKLIKTITKKKTINYYNEIINSEKSQNEEILRQQRYEIFKQYITKYNLEYFLLGHNLTDRIESSFMNMLRGCNIKGFLAMQKQSSHHLLPCKVLRPLLNLTKKEIQSYCDKNNIPYVIDQSNNNSEVSLRNKLRNDILPQITQFANKSTKETNTFFESLKNIYTNLEGNNNYNLGITTQKIHLKLIHKPAQRQANFAYQVLLNLDEITENEIMLLFTQLNITNNITKATLKERVNFIRRGKNSHKYLNKTYFFITNKQLFVIQAPKDFWKIDKQENNKKNLDNTQLITTLGTYNIDNQLLEIKDKKYLDCIIGYPQKGMKFKGKTRNKYCINNKIPIFYRNYIPLIYTYNKEKETNEIKNYFYPFKN